MIQVKTGVALTVAPMMNNFCRYLLKRGFTVGHGLYWFQSGIATSTLKPVYAVLLQNLIKCQCLGPFIQILNALLQSIQHPVETGHCNPSTPERVQLSGTFVTFANLYLIPLITSPYQRRCDQWDYMQIG